jgi:hypothetical protein
LFSKEMIEGEKLHAQFVRNTATVKRPLKPTSEVQTHKFALSALMATSPRAYGKSSMDIKKERKMAN